MAKEIERKYLVNPDKWQKIKKPKGESFRQGYLSTDPYKTIRVRLKDEKEAFLTIKGVTSGATRTEFEYKIPIEDARELLDTFPVKELNKIRYKITYAGKLWEVDEFLGENAGLLMAEIELASEKEDFIIPDWIEEEVTNQEKYYNAKLVLQPFKNW